MVNQGVNVLSPFWLVYDVPWVLVVFRWCFWFLFVFFPKSIYHGLEILFLGVSWRMVLAAKQAMPPGAPLGLQLWSWVFVVLALR
jgi:hypothetical protein